MSNLRRKARPKPWIAKKQGRNRRNKDGDLIKPFENFNPVSSNFYKTEEWRATRKAVIDRDAICQWCLNLARITPATDADHVVPVARCESEGISPYDQSNIVGSCRSCNSRRAAYEAKGTHINTFQGWVEFLRRKLIDKLKQ